MQVSAARWIATRIVAAGMIVGCCACDDGGSGGGGGVGLRADRVTLSNTGTTAQVCVSMETGGEAVAGTQNDLIWHGECLTLTGGCSVNPATGKQLSTASRSNSLRALLLSLSDVNPIPDGVLYCCTFRPERLAAGECCPVRLSEAHASDPAGNALATFGDDGAVCIE